jgi:heme oxygenase (biliverdin-IX-beta and delta-forming)
MNSKDGKTTNDSAMSRPGSMLHELKHATAPEHERLEVLSCIHQSLRSLPQYQVLLSKMFAIYVALETRLRLVTELPRHLPDISERWKLDNLAGDLRSLAIPVQTVAHCSDVPAIESVPQALGCMYVLEGSTLGGQILSREILIHLNLTPDAGGAFFSSYGSNVGPMWRRFTKSLEDYVESNPSHRQAILAIAVATFQFFSRHLIDQPLHPTTYPQDRAYPSLGPD